MKNWRMEIIVFLIRFVFEFWGIGQVVNFESLQNIVKKPIIY